MFIRSSAKKLALTAALVVPLTLVACGGDAGDDAAASSSSTTRTTGSATMSPTTGSSTSTEATPEESTEATPEEEQPAPAPEPDPAPAPAPPAPVGGALPASPEDAAAIDALIRGSVNQPTVRSMVAYVPSNACSRVIEANGGAAALDFSQYPDAPLSDYPNLNPGTVDSVTEIMVEGDAASALVAASNQGQQTVETQRFLREGGQWKFCD